jgi:hypothetical protein
VALSGCGTVPEALFSNRVSCTVAKDGAMYVSMYGPIGIASKIEQIDADVICGESAPKTAVIGR